MRLFPLSIPAALLVAAFGAILPGATLAGDGVPPSRVAIWQGTDFPGADLGRDLGLHQLRGDRRQ